MSQVVWLRDGFPPNKRLGRLSTASDISAGYSLMLDNRAVFSLSPNDPLIAEVQNGRMVEIRTVKAAGYALRDNERPATGNIRSYSGGAEQLYAQGFKTPPVGDTTLTGVSLPLAKVGTPTGNLTVKVHSAAGGGGPDSVLATSDALDVSTLTATETWKDFTFDAVTLAADTIYYISWDVSGLTHDNDNYVRWYVANVYALADHSYDSEDGDIWALVGLYDCKLRFTYSHIALRSIDLLSPWIGWIKRLEYDHGSGMVRVECDDVATLMGERIAGISSSRSGAAGLIARQLLYEANSRNPFGLVWDTASEAGTPVSAIDLGGSSLLDALNELAARTGDEWWIAVEARSDDLALALHWGRQAGFDYSQSVYLREGYEISSFSYEQDALEDMGSVVVIGGGAEVENRAAAMRTYSQETANLPGVTVQPSSERRLRDVPLPPVLRRERVMVSPRELDVSALAQEAETELEPSFNTSEMIRLTVNSRADWQKLALGNSVRVRLGSVPWGDVDRKVRIMEAQPGDGEILLEVRLLYD